MVAVNDLGSPEALARLLARDSVYGRFEVPVTTSGNVMVVGGRRILLPAQRDVKALPWAELEVDVVVESTGRFTAREKAAGHLDAGAPRVVVSAPSKGADVTFVMGVNDDTFDPSSTPGDLQRLVHDQLSGPDGESPRRRLRRREQGFMTTVHAYTGDQQLVDALHKDPRRARAGGGEHSSHHDRSGPGNGRGAAALAGRLDGIALRVPVPDGSMTDLVATLRETPGADDVRRAFEQAASSGPLFGRLEYSEDDLVSTDILGNPASCVFDAGLTMVKGRVVKVLGWYDNEWGYANRLAELAAKVGAAPKA